MTVLWDRVHCCLPLLPRAIAPRTKKSSRGSAGLLGKGGNSRTQADSGSESAAAARAAPHLVGSLPSAGQARASRGILGAPGPCDSWLTLPASLQRALSCPLPQAHLQMVSGAGPAPPAGLRLCPGQRPPPRPHRRPVSGDWAFGGSAGRQDQPGLASASACFPPHSSSRLILAAENLQGGDRG